MLARFIPVVNVSVQFTPLQKTTEVQRLVSIYRASPEGLHRRGWIANSDCSNSLTQELRHHPQNDAEIMQVMDRLHHYMRTNHPHKRVAEMLRGVGDHGQYVIQVRFGSCC